MSGAGRVVVFGATGASGRQLAAWLARTPGLQLIIAGRDRTRLAALRRTLPGEVAIARADASDARSVNALVQAARVVVAAASPYTRVGEPILAACARAGVHYVDICGEPAHVRRMIDRYHDTAIASGATIVPMCGFDAAISDLGVQHLIDQLKQQGTTPRDIRALFRCGGGWNAGTEAATEALLERPEDVRAMEHPLLLAPGAVAPHARDPAGPEYDAAVHRWVAPFWMGPINSRVVYRSAALTHAGAPIPFRYAEYWDPGGGALSWWPAMTAAWSWGTWRSVTTVPALARVSMPAWRSATRLAAASVPHRGFRALFCGTGHDGTRAWTLLAGEEEPADGATALIASAAALGLRDGEARASGVLTPATALGPALLARLVRGGLRVATGMGPVPPAHG